jgi:hypothetical protein
MLEVFAFSEGRLIAHEGFEPENATGLALFAEEILDGYDGVPSGEGGVAEARVVAAYLKRRQADVEAVSLVSVADLVEAAGRVTERAAGTGGAGADALH